MQVLKFGGTSVASAEIIEQVKNIAVGKAANGKALIVVSAFGGVTNKLVECVELAPENLEQALKIVDELQERHLNESFKLLNEKNLKDIEQFVAEQIEDLKRVVNGINILGDVTPKVNDKIISTGERLSSRIINTYFNQEIISELLDPLKIIQTDNNFGNASVNYKVTYENIKNINTGSGNLFVCPGFMGATAEGELTTLGRGGSDFTAALFAAGFGAELLEIWTDVSGMMTADPRVVKTAKIIPNVTYEEAMEFSHFGAKVIYPPTIQPVLQAGISIRIKNTHRPEDEGTLISKDDTVSEKAVQGITSITNIALVNFKGPGMVGVPKMSSRLFRSFAKQNINIILITQASSEHTISVALKEEDAALAVKAVEEEFSMEIEAGKIDPLKVEKDLAIIAVVGSNMKNQVGVSGRMFSTLGSNGVNVKAIAQGSSERNISAVIDAKNLKKALNTLHEGFFLNGRKRINLFIIGVGTVGGELLLQLKNQAPKLFEKEHLDIRVVGLANSRKMVFEGEGVNLHNWNSELDKGVEMDIKRFVSSMAELNLRNSIFIDNTASGDVPEYYIDVLKNSVSIVTPNKIAASSNFEHYLNLRKIALKYRNQFLFETNVGAGLPVISTLKDLVKSGDRIDTIQAVLSGSLNFIFNNYDGKDSFASVVKRAQEEGYTEPDPRVDLSGLDVRRKLLILMREAGFESEIEDISGEQFIPKACFDAKDVDSFYKVLEENEEQFQKMLAKAKKAGNRLKFIAEFKDGEATTRLIEVGQDHPFYNLEGKDNIILFFTRRYQEQPLLIKGAGAGAEVTASGIFADIIKVAHS
ncbi:MAG: bifunctional aspartate kinase/homoserine dehydrogenase I [Bacteroidota bacterium]